MNSYVCKFPNSGRAEWWLFAGIFLLIFGSRMFIFDYAGTPLPYYDQWIGEYQNFYLNLLDNRPLWDLFLIGHNEHRLVTTKMLSFLGYCLNGYWDVHFLVVLTAIMRGIEGVLVYFLLAKPLNKTRKLIVLLCIVYFFCWPVSGYNLMSGFQIGFFLADISLLLALLVLINWQQSFKSVLTIFTLYIIGLLSFSTALLTPGVLLFAHLLHREKRRGWWPLFIAMVTVGGLFYAFKPPMIMKTTFNFAERVKFFLELAVWPINSWLVGAIILSGCCILILLCLRSRGCTKQQAAAAGILAYSLGNALLLAITRGPQNFHMRHWDTLTLTAVGLVALLAGIESNRYMLNRIFLGLAVSLSFVYIIRSANESNLVSIPYLQAAHNHREANIEYYRTMLFTGSFIADIDRVNTDLARRDYKFFDDPKLRYALHPGTPAIMFANYKKALLILSPDIVNNSVKKSMISHLLTILIKNGWLFTVIGAGIVCTILYGNLRTSKK